MTKKINVELNPLALGHWLQNMCEDMESELFVGNVAQVKALQIRLELILDIAAALQIESWNGPQTMQGMLEQRGLL